MERQKNEISRKTLNSCRILYCYNQYTKGKLIAFINPNQNNQAKSYEWVNYQSGEQWKKLLLNGASKKQWPRADVSPQKKKEVRKCYSKQLIHSNDFDVSRSLKHLQKIV